MKKRPPTYVRFVCTRLIDGRRHRLGLFQTLDDASEYGEAPSWALKEIGETRGWFKANLAVPPAYKTGEAIGMAREALAWFKPAARERIARMHGLSRALSACGVRVEMLTTRYPGVVSYEDRFQVVAVPHKTRF